MTLDGSRGKIGVWPDHVVVRSRSFGCRTQDLIEFIFTVLGSVFL